MIPRHLSPKIKKAAEAYPVVTLTGPRQSGKTTLVKALFPKYQYISLENPDQRAFAIDDPNGFLKQFKTGVILDEVQRAPDLFSYLQTIVDEHDKPGQFILTGSQNFLLLEKISQSLAGRTAIFYLLPFSQGELLKRPAVDSGSYPGRKYAKDVPSGLWETIMTGFYPRIHDKNLTPRQWLAGYYQTYLERDVRSIVNVGELETFGRFIRLCAGRTGQLVNFSSLGADCGISNMTAKRWLSILQASFIIAMLPPHYENFSKRIIKSPKLYFLDTGLLSFLLGIRTEEELLLHPLRGAVFETFVFAELYKAYFNDGEVPAIYFWQDAKKHEVDFVLDRGKKLIPIEAKSGETLSSDSFKGLKYWQDLAGNKAGQPVLIYGGHESYVRQDVQVLSWQQL